MAANIKTVKNYIYNGLGFPIILDKVIFKKITGEWLPQIDVEAVSDLVLRALPSKPSKLTGDEIKFIRTFLGKSKSAFAEIFKLSHTAIAKWEKSEQNFAPISSSQEIVLRLYVKDLLNVSNKDFYNTYKKIEDYVHLEDETPMKIAL
jgi:DNA-binding transcriptional regulator YiaG